MHMYPYLREVTVTLLPKLCKLGMDHRLLKVSDYVTPHICLYSIYK